MKRNAHVNSKAEYDRPTTIICKDTIIETTKLISKSSVQVSGQVIGALEVQASLVVAQSGKIIGNVKTEFILVAGEVMGNIEATQQIHVTETGKIVGDIICGSITVDEGAKMEGNFKMISIPQSTPQPAQSKKEQI